MKYGEAIGILNKLRNYYNLRQGGKEYVQVLEMSIYIMCKYQEIEQIYQKWNVVNDFSYNQAMREIGEVVEDDK